MPAPETTPKPTADGGCSYDECPEYDGKRCRLTGFRPGGCEPTWKTMAAALRTAARDLEQLLVPPPPALDAADIDDQTRRDLEGILARLRCAIPSAPGGKRHA
jgi:hypothetical protein